MPLIDIYILYNLHRWNPLRIINSDFSTTTLSHVIILFFTIGSWVSKHMYRSICLNVYGMFPAEQSYLILSYPRRVPSPLPSHSPIYYDELQQQGTDDRLPLPNQHALTDISSLSLSLSKSTCISHLLLPVHMGFSTSLISLYKVCQWYHTLLAIFLKL